MKTVTVQLPPNPLEPTIWRKKKKEPIEMKPNKEYDLHQKDNYVRL